MAATEGQTAEEISALEANIAAKGEKSHVRARLPMLLYHCFHQGKTPIITPTLQICLEMNALLHHLEVQ